MTEHKAFHFEHDASLADFTIPMKAYFAAHSDSWFDHIATAVLVLDTHIASEPRILLLQRASSDSNPNKWEPPGGGVDEEDETILHAAARELWEEAGLEAARFIKPVGGQQLFTSRSGKKVCRFTFLVQVKTANNSAPDVKLDIEEHQNFVWATEDDVKAKKADRTRLDFTSDEVEQDIFAAFSNSRSN